MIEILKCCEAATGVTCDASIMHVTVSFGQAGGVFYGITFQNGNQIAVKITTKVKGSLQRRFDIASTMACENGPFWNDNKKICRDSTLWCAGALSIGTKKKSGLKFRTFPVANGTAFPVVPIIRKVRTAWRSIPKISKL